MKILVLLSVMSWGLNAVFGSPNDHIARMDQDLKEAQVALNQGAYQKAYQKVQMLDDEFNYIRWYFKKGERVQMLLEIEQFGHAISVLNIKKSKKILVDMKKDWVTMKKKRLEHPK